MTTAETLKRQLADEVRRWRGSVPVPAAARVLGISERTLEGIEQGRGFNYPTLLRHALKTLEVSHGDAA